MPANSVRKLQDRELEVREASGSTPDFGARQIAPNAKSYLKAKFDQGQGNLGLYERVILG